MGNTLEEIQETIQDSFLTELYDALVEEKDETVKNMIREEIRKREM